MPDSAIATEGLQSFFETMQSASGASNLDRLAAMYAPTVMVAGPKGAQVVTAAEILQAIPHRKRLFELAGHRRTTLVGFEDRVLTDRYSLVRTEWKWEFERAGDVPAVLVLPSTFLVDRLGEAPRILMYVMHHDIGEALRERGLLPPAA